MCVLVFQFVHQCDICVVGEQVCIFKYNFGESLSGCECVWHCVRCANHTHTPVCEKIYRIYIFSQDGISNVHLTHSINSIGGYEVHAGSMCDCTTPFQTNLLNGTSCYPSQCLSNMVAEIFANATVNASCCVDVAVWPAIPCINAARITFFIKTLPNASTSDASNFASTGPSYVYSTQTMSTSVVSDSSLFGTLTLVPNADSTLRDVVQEAVTNLQTYLASSPNTTLETIVPSPFNVTAPQPPPNTGGSSGTSMPMFGIICIVAIVAIVLIWIAIKVAKKRAVKKLDTGENDPPTVRVDIPGVKERSSSTRSTLYESVNPTTVNALARGRAATRLTVSEPQPSVHTVDDVDDPHDENVDEAFMDGGHTPRSDSVLQELVCIDEPGTPAIVTDDNGVHEEARVYEEDAEHQRFERSETTHSDTVRVRQIHRGSLDQNHSKRFEETLASLATKLNFREAEPIQPQ